MPSLSRKFVAFMLGFACFPASGAATLAGDGWSLQPPPGCTASVETVAANPLYSEQARRDLARDPLLSLKPDFSNMPRHLRFDLSACYRLRGMFGASLRVLPVAEYAHIYDKNAAGTDSDWGSGVLAELKTWLSGNPAAVARWPMVPYLDMSPQFTVERRALQFPGGHGIRVVTQFVPDVGFAESGIVSYVFQGLSDDGRDFVLLTVPLALEGAAADRAEQHLGFSLDAIERDEEQRRRYEAAIAALVARHGTRPALAELDAIVESLRRTDAPASRPDQP